MKPQPITAYLIVLYCYDPPLVAAVHSTREAADYVVGCYGDEKTARVVEVREVRKS